MNYLKERVAYLKGLSEGMNLDVNTNEGKLLKAIIEVLDDIALAVSDIEEVQEELSGQVDDIDADLAEVESLLFEDYDEDDYEDESDLGELECPHCGRKFVVDKSMFCEEDDSVVCPECHKDIEVEWDDCCCDEHNHDD